MGEGEGGKDGSVTLDDVEAALWRGGVRGDAVDGIIALVARLAAGRAGAAGWAASGAESAGDGAGGSQDLGEPRGGERLSEGVERAWLEPGPEPAAELAGRQAGSAGVGRPGEVSARGGGRGGTAAPHAPGGVSTSFTTETKACGTCRVRQPLGEFHRDRNKADGRRATCRTCESARRRARRAELSAVRRVAALGGDVGPLLEAIERRLAVERDLALRWTRGERVDAALNEVEPALDHATLAEVLG